MKKDMLKQKDFIKFLLIELETRKNSCELTRTIQQKQIIKALIKKQKRTVKALENRYGEALKHWVNNDNESFDDVRHAINTYDEFNDVLISLKEMKKEIDFKISCLVDDNLQNIKFNINHNSEQ